MPEPAFDISTASAGLTQLSDTREPLDLLDMDPQELQEVLQRASLPKYALSQILNWVYKRGVVSFSEMTNIRADARPSLSGQLSIPRANIVVRKVSQDGTKKYLFKLKDGALIESVLIKQDRHMTLCLSSQVGCAMGCKFCRTATMGFKRNLTVSEILQQVLAVQDEARLSGDKINYVVFMGMGEPLHNLKNVAKAIRAISNDWGIGLAPRRITVSTSGLVPAIRRFGELDLGINLAISLNASNDKVRSEIMPVNRSYPIAELLSAVNEFPVNSRQKVTLEYVMLCGVNTSDENLKELIKLTRGSKVKINLIPYNENAGLGFKAPHREQVYAWQSKLYKSGVDATVRWSKGLDIDAACGQLATTGLS